MSNKYRELQAISAKCEVGIKARKAFREMAKIFHPDKASMYDAHTSLEEMHRDYLRAEFEHNARQPIG
jgi:DnaJ-class molecular chaperone